MKKKQLDITGMKFNLLTAIEFVSIGNEYQYFWKFKCDCGNFKIIKKSPVTRGITRSCGCIRKEEAKKATKTHGLTNSRIYKTWDGMIQRCTNPKTPSYKWYGARGISVCKDWFVFENFYKDMGDRPIGMSLDRINNDGNYEPLNCKWSTSKEQALNKRTTVKVKFNGASVSLSELCKNFSIKYSVVKKRLGRGWSLNDALTMCLQK